MVVAKNATIMKKDLRKISSQMCRAADQRVYEFFYA